RARNQVDGLRQIGERHEGFTQRQGRQRPFRYAEHAECRQCKASFEDVPTGALILHGGSFALWKPYINRVRSREADLATGSKFVNMQRQALPALTLSACGANPTGANLDVSCNLEVCLGKR